MIRKIKIYTTNGMPGTIDTNATTLAGIKPLLRERNINFEGMKMLVGETKNELSMDESVLPEGDFKLYLMPAKTKSGVDFDDMEDNIENIQTNLQRVEDKVDQVLNALKKKNASTATSYSVPSVASASIMSMEDQREIEKLKALAGGSSNSDWD